MSLRRLALICALAACAAAGAIVLGTAVPAGADLNSRINASANRAEALFVTRKAVEWHLGNAYRKLDVRSRRELPAALGAPEGEER